MLGFLTYPDFPRGVSEAVHVLLHRPVERHSPVMPGQDDRPAILTCAADIALYLSKGVITFAD